MLGISDKSTVLQISMKSWQIKIRARDSQSIPRSPATFNLLLRYESNDIVPIGSVINDNLNDSRGHLKYGRRLGRR